MRIWSVHPRHLDRIGLVACWRETLLAQAVLTGRTKGYLHHPQLERFRAAPDPVAAVGTYLAAVAGDATRRGYRFDVGRIVQGDVAPAPLPVTAGQLAFEWQHLGDKLRRRSPDVAAVWAGESVSPHPLFRVIPGGIETWERGATRPEEEP